MLSRWRTLIYLTKIWLLNSSGSRQDPALGSYEHGNQLWFDKMRRLYWPVDRVLASEKDWQSIHIIRHDTTRHGTTWQKPACIHIYREWQAEYFLPIQTNSLCLCRLPVGDRLLWIRGCQNHTKIFYHVESCRVVPHNVKRPLCSWLHIPERVVLCDGVLHHEIMPDVGY
jgi:hypothetical protein